MKHSYAAKVLKQKGVRIFAQGKEILNQQYLKNHPKLTTKIPKQSNFVRDYIAEDGLKLISDYRQLLDLGFKLIKFRTSSFFRGQKIGYRVVRINYPEKKEQLVEDMPIAHHVLYDVIQQCLQGVGRNFGIGGKSDWVNMKKDFPGEREIHGSALDLNMPASRREYSKMLFGYEEQNCFSIPEGVIGVTDDGLIAAIPPASKTDPHFRWIFGAKRTGKSLLTDNLQCIDFHKFHLHCVDINDVKGETKTRCLEWENGSFKTELNRFGEPTIPLPCVYLHPTTNENYTKIHYLESGFDVSLPLKQLLKDDQLVTYNKDWNMEGTSTQLEWRNMIFHEGKIRKDGLAYAESLDQAYGIINRYIKEPGMNAKSKRVLSDIFNTGMVDKGTDVPSKWILSYKNKQYAETPWNVCMYSGLFPFLITSNIRKRELWFALWLRYVIEDIIRFSAVQEKVTSIYIDEIEELLKNPVTRDIIERAVRECAQHHVGITMVNHNYEYVKKAIYTHTVGMSSYKFVFTTAEKELINALKKEGLSSSQALEIPELKQFQCYAFGKFILYDMDGNKMENKGPIKINRIKPPNCQHYGG